MPASYVVDITRAYSGTEDKIVAEVLRRNASTQPECLILGREDQRDTIETSFPETHTHFFAGLPDDATVAERIAEEVRQQVNPAPQAPVVVFSFRPAVIQRLGSLTLVSQHIDTRPLRDYLPQDTAPHAEGRPAGNRWPEQLMPLSEALEILKRVLSPPGNPVPKTSLRHLLIREDARFDKDVHHLAATPRLISVLLREARSRNIVTLSGTEPQVMVELTADTGDAAGRPGTRSTGAAPPAPPRPTSPVVPPRPATPAQVKPAEQASSETAASTDRGRSWDFVNHLRTVELGPYPEVRHHLYEQIRRVLDGEPRAADIRQLARWAVKATRKEAPASFPRPNRDSGLPKERYDWRGLENFAIRILTRGGLAVGEDGTPLPAHTSVWQARRARVAAAAPENLAVRLDAELVLALLAHFRDVTLDDIDHLAGALLASRDESARDHIEATIDRLQDEGRVTADPVSDALLPADATGS